MPEAPRLGELRHRVAVMAPPPEPDRNSFGEPKDAASLVTTRWGKVEFLSGRELEHARQVAAEVSALVALRWLNLPASCHLETLGRTLHILAAIDPDGTKNWLFVYCVERAT